jgi:membrane fusion protein, copper/silver efflux system
MKNHWWVFVWLTLVLVPAGVAQEQHLHDHSDATQPAEERGLDDLEELKGLDMEAIQQQGTVQQLGPATIEISPERQQLIGVRIGTVEKKSLEKLIRTVGRIDYDEKRIFIVSPKVGGWIEDLFVDFTGRFVRKGDPLLTIYSPELVATQEEYLLALHAREEWSKSSFPEVSTGGNLLAESAHRRLKLWDISDEQIEALRESGKIQKTLTLYSPFSGVVLEKMVNRGMYIMPGTTVYRIGDLSVVWLIADIYEYELPLIRLGQQANMRLSYVADSDFTGKAIYIYPYLDPQTRTAKVRFEFPNPAGLLKPEMFAEVEIKIQLGTRLAVVESAVIDTGVRKIAIIAKGTGYFEPREVQLGTKAEGYFEVIDGISAGERVVTSANFLIDSESKLKEAIGGMAHAHGSH